MHALKELLRNFFTHKDFLPANWTGTLFSPLQILFCAFCAVLIVLLAVLCAKKSEDLRKRVFFILWAIMLITEPIIVIYDSVAGASIYLDWNGALPFWPCSTFLFTLPFAIFGKGNVRWAASGNICTLGLLGGLVNFFYPASYISYYSCISFAGFRTIFFHGAMIFTALTMLLSGYHSFKEATTLRRVLLPLVPTLLISVPANILNLVFPNADYLFLKLESFFFAPIGRAIPYIVSALITYLFYLIINCVPYLPSYIAGRHKRTRAQHDKR